MKFPSDAPVTRKKLQELQHRIDAAGLDLNRIAVKYIRGGGPGGQKVNKTSSGVWLKDESSGVFVKWTRERSRALNRFLALRELVSRIELQQAGRLQ